MPNYAKQEGFAVNIHKEGKGNIIRWRCIHSGRHNNPHNLLSEGTEKSQRQAAIRAGIF